MFFFEAMHRGGLGFQLAGALLASKGLGRDLSSQSKDVSVENHLSIR